MTLLSRPVLSVGIIGTGILLLGWLARPSDPTPPSPAAGPAKSMPLPALDSSGGEGGPRPRQPGSILPSAGEGRSAPGPASPEKAPDLAARLQSKNRETRDLQEKILRMKKDLRDSAEGSRERKDLQEQMKDLQDRHRVAQESVQAVRREARSWLSENPEHPPAFYRLLVDGTEGPEGERAGGLLAGHFDNAALESLVLGDLAAGAPARKNLLALQVVEARATPDRVAAVTGLALGAGTEPVRLGAVHVLRVYKDDPDALRERAGLFSTLVSLARGAESSDVRREALIGLAREETPSPELVTMVRGVAEKDSNESVRAVAAQALKRWEQQ